MGSMGHLQGATFNQMISEWLDMIPNFRHILNHCPRSNKELDSAYQAILDLS